MNESNTSIPAKGKIPLNDTVFSTQIAPFNNTTPKGEPTSYFDCY